MGAYRNFDIKSKEFWKDGWGGLGLAILAALTIRWGLFESYVIPSGSMLPTLLINDHIFVNKLVYGLRIPFSEQWLMKFTEPRRGEIIVFKNPKRMDMFLIKRVVGVPGDRIYFSNGNLYINDVLQEKVAAPDHTVWKSIREYEFKQDREGYDSLKNYEHFTEKLQIKDGIKEHSVLTRIGGGPLDPAGPVTVPEGHLFMMGDNRHNSSDSRYWGFMPQENIVGRAAMIWLSCDEMLAKPGTDPDHPGIPILSALCNPLTIRWSRLGNMISNL